jgi:RNA polymerase sigma factor (TIGR02999 family)
MSDVTRILSQMESGDPTAPEHLSRVIYDELRKLAAAKLGQEKPGQTLQATALVHEVWLRLAGDGPASHQQPRWNSRNHFFASAAEAMRRILVESARRKATRKRGGELAREAVLDSDIATAAPPEEVVAVHDALDALRDHDHLAADLVKLHYFGGFSLEEAGEMVGMSRATAYRMWTYARTWLRAHIESRDKTDRAAQF